MHIDRPAIVGPERLVLRTSAALYVDDLKAVGEFTVIPVSPSRRVMEGFQVSGWLSWRESL